MITEATSTAAPARPLTGKEARRMRSAKVKTEVENNNPIYDDDFYKYELFLMQGCVILMREFPVIFRLQGRVDRMENSIQPLSMKIDIVLSRLDEVFKKRKLKKDDMEKIFQGIIGDSSGT